MELIKQGILPILTLFIAIISLFVNPDKIKTPGGFFKRPKLLTLMVLLIISTSITIYFSFTDSNEKRNEIKKNEETINGLIELLKDFRRETNEYFVSLSSKLSSFGWLKPEEARTEDIEESMKANEYRSILLDLDSSKLKNITVQYFPKNVDGDKVTKAFEELGYKVEIGNTQVNNVESNSIWFGSNVKIEDVKLVALTLIRAGVKIKVIRPFKNSGTRKNLIQVGADALYQNRNALTVNEIVQASNFERNE